MDPQLRADEFLRVTANQIHPPVDCWQQLLHKQQIAKFVEIIGTLDKPLGSKELETAHKSLIGELETAVSASDKVLDHIMKQEVTTHGGRGCAFVCTVVCRVCAMVILSIEYAIQSLESRPTHDRRVELAELERIKRLVKALVGKARVTYVHKVGADNRSSITSRLFDRLETESCVPASTLEVNKCKELFMDAFNDTSVQQAVLAALDQSEDQGTDIGQSDRPKIADEEGTKLDQTNVENSGFIGDCFSRCCSCLSSK